MIMKIAPSLLSADFGRLGEEVKKITECGADAIHADIMDGHFVPNISFGPMMIPFIKKHTSLPVHAHLMIENPDRYIKQLSDALADIITVHIEVIGHQYDIFQKIRNLGKHPGVSLNPNTNVTELENILDQVDVVLVMSVQPGFGGQAFMPSSLQTIKTLSRIRTKKNLCFEIEVDGGINLETAKQVREKGADVAVMGSALFGSGNYKDVIDRIHQLG